MIAIIEQRVTRSKTKESVVDEQSEWVEGLQYTPPDTNRSRRGCRYPRDQQRSYRDDIGHQNQYQIYTNIAGRRARARAKDRLVCAVCSRAAYGPSYRLGEH